MRCKPIGLQQYVRYSPTSGMLSVWRMICVLGRAFVIDLGGSEHVIVPVPYRSLRVDCAMVNGRERPLSRREQDDINNNIIRKCCILTST
jgi:hypothetical protein